uniref:Integrating conjugative element protein n=1 Tax=Clandestinovirus TaxID=2831644 RepID=A0A8F8KL87_9VIRU|nr:integrating conjugative element protein [Clandestinovirus]
MNCEKKNKEVNTDLDELRKENKEITAELDELRMACTAISDQEINRVKAHFFDINNVLVPDKEDGTQTNPGQ